METKIKHTLKRWESSLLNFGKIDQWKINEDFTILGNYIAKEKSASLRNAVRDCRDCAISEVMDTDLLLNKVQTANRILDNVTVTQSDNVSQKSSVSQSKRFSCVTKKLYNEKIRFKGGENLCNIDISLEEGRTSRKVRRIVEKRMTQAYYRFNKKHEEDNSDRHYSKRAVSFQLHNLGNIECVSGMDRTDSTHWKIVYDPISECKMLKQKQGYSSYEEANEAAKLHMLKHPYHKYPVNAYKCKHCSKWHIGHTTPEEEKVFAAGVTFLENVS